MKMKVRNKAAFTDAETFLEKENKKVSYEAALEGIVLLENDGILPLEPGKIALYGAGADMTIKGGTGSGEVHERHVVSILEGLENAGFTVTTKRWIREYAEEYEKGEEAFAKEFQRRFLKPWKLDMINFMSTLYQYPYGQPVTKQDVQDSDTDTCIYVVARQAGEGTDRKLEKKEYQLSGEEKANLTMCAANYEKMIVVINVGSVFDLSFLDEIPGINAVVYYAQQGMMGGQAFADLLCGKESPSGKTSDTWPNKYEDIPGAMDYSYLNGNVDEEYYREGIYVGYRYFDSFGVEPLFPFGYGLSYTSFKISFCGLRVNERSLEAEAEVTNLGEIYSGREVVQVYVTLPQTGEAKEYRRLAGFAKTDTLKPGERQKVSALIRQKELAVFSEKRQAWIVEQGTYGIWIGNSSASVELVAEIQVSQDTIIEETSRICPPAAEIKEPAGAEHAAELEKKWLEHGKKIGVPVYSFVPGVEEKTECVTPYAEDYPVEDLIPLLYGNITDGASTLGSAGIRVPGSAGETTEALEEKYGIRSLIMADGPAGLRLRQWYQVDRASDTVYGTGVLGSLENGFLDSAEIHEDADTYYQYCTAFPVGTALAQTWDPELLETFGRAVAEEMEEFHVDLWLAPGMNIQRNPLCGRNFEYYSEDPLLSGIMAAAVTRGVQSRPGCGVTIKHYACNNQEDNRMGVDVCVSQRTLREIYLRGFEIAVKESRPAAVMSSYNLVNGVHAANSRDLCTTLVREEWGFDGVIMSDWNTTVPEDGSIPWQCAAAGNDIIMPGNRQDDADIRQAYAEGKLSEREIRACAGRVLRLAEKLSEKEEG